eukprot:gene10483-biopygen8038
MCIPHPLLTQAGRRSTQRCSSLATQTTSLLPSDANATRQRPRGSPFSLSDAERRDAVHLATHERGRKGLRETWSDAKEGTQFT